MNNHLLPAGSSPLEVAAAQALACLADIPVPLRELWHPDRCPVLLLPYLAWAWSVDRWDVDWSESTKREAIKVAMFVHKHKGTIGAIRRVVEPFGYLIRVTEWWQNQDPPGTFRLDIGVMDTGITEATYFELERLIFDAKPASRHLTGLSIQLETGGTTYCAVTSYDGDVLTVYPYLPQEIIVTGADVVGAGIHVIDEMRINA
ncbi:Tail protein I (GpI) [Xenorhabdus nematophila ATCC 19061]|uniref:Tail protein I (GpI) n=1 Tax=Xenorhabdus nematophila (strain ATCC 19061 / DSM 3370 / CCUG 14189 / LMG 1036 / NCIMB 9965 / AN6) TaxID=406817 RepID=D3VKL2_XENNA|nr:phage tail protein I [Xenorhabdus nematophila]CBJ91120.1 Tail protein I (GpI) [Xenorhabdus nematophila ATCC 19061]CEK23942.1 Tail protein I (GpI) [Xenorhabdus nematophila AN6/1]